MGGRRKPVFSENFADNLDHIRGFLGSVGSIAFERLLDRLFDDMIPLLCEFPRSGRDFLTSGTGSNETLSSLRRLKRALKKRDELREFVMDDYILLYAIRKNLAVFLAIKHHRQLSFDFRRFWR
jgi:hypothetical protein